MLNALTFDVEDYFHVEAARPFVDAADWSRYPPRVEETTRTVLDVLDEHGVTATFFVLGWVADHHGALVRDIAARGHEVACHSYAHRMVTTLTPAAFRSDLRRAKAAIEDAISAPVVGYRAPTFSVTRQSLWALNTLADEGFEYDSSVFPIYHDRYGIPDAPHFPHRIPLAGDREIIEFPMTTVAIGPLRLPLLGGGYFRLAPYCALQAGLRHVNRRHRQPGIVYLHPWELDSNPPHLPLRGLSRARHYINIRGTASKLARLLRNFRFGSMRRVLDEHELARVAR